MPSFGDNAQFPLNAVGTRGEGAFLGMERMFFQGQTGLISTMYGIVGVSATRLSTGTYQLRHPPCVAADILPTVQAPSGMYFQTNVAQHNANSGVAILQFFQEANPTIISSGYGQLMDAPTGTQVKLLFFVSPYSAF
jgi:hypothetical protein